MSLKHYPTKLIVSNIESDISNFNILERAYSLIVNNNTGSLSIVAEWS